MISPETMIVSIIAAVFASTGFWAFVTYMVQRRDAKESSEGQMLKGLGHDRIIELGSTYLERGFITKDEYENIHEYLYKPYTKLGGNGTAKKIMDEVNSLPLKETKAR